MSLKLEVVLVNMYVFGLCYKECVGILIENIYVVCIVFVYVCD